jgi:Ca2+:H+ antiporter
MANYYNNDANNANLQNRFQPGNGQSSQPYNNGYTQQTQLPHDGIPLRNLPSNPSSTTKLQHENTPAIGHTDGHSRRNNWKVKQIHEDGESGRKGFHPFHFLHVCWMSSNTISKWVNVLWPVVPAAIAVHFALPERHVLIFTLNYIAMVPAANTIGFAGQELARKLPKVLGVLIEVTLGSLVEIILFIVLVVKGDQNIPVVRAAILGSILANLLLCMGLCFVAGGVRHVEQEFHESISEVGSGLMLVAGSK